MPRQERAPGQRKRGKGKPGPEFAIAVAPPLKEGGLVPCVIIASSRGAKEALVKEMKQSGIVFVRPRKESGTVFGFGGINWGNCEWAPKGPDKPKWTTFSNPIKN